MRRDRGSPRHPRADGARGLVSAAAIALSVVVSGCGDTTMQPAWVAAHPDTALLSFQTTAPGVCAITVQYPNDAPAVISYLGGVYVQVRRRAHPANPAGSEIDHSGNWRIDKLANGDLLLVTPGDAFEYRVEQNC
ncbi:MAG: hypothetical protein ABI352_11260 [Candidatus Dormibacter sp.]